jgi:hypothetical protein
MQNRRTLLTAMGTGAALSLLSSTRKAIAQASPDEIPTNIKTTPTDPFILWLHGIYVPIAIGDDSVPDLGLTDGSGNPITLNDGSYSRTKIYPVFGVPDAEGENEKDINNNVPNTPIGKFYVQFNGSLCAYQLPGGAIAQQFLPVPDGALPGYNAFVTSSDGHGGSFLTGTFELNVVDATGIYKRFNGGHNHMVDRLHQLANGSFDEFCFCNISQYPFP